MDFAAYGLSGNEIKEIVDNLHDRAWRLENLYYITDKEGHVVKFKLNTFQKELLDNLHNQNLILKARQLGCTTFFAILYLDACFWCSHVNAAIIADKKDSSEEIFKSKVKFALDRMPKWVELFNKARVDNARELRFDNGSTYRVSTSVRSGTINFLHISEFGKICKEDPLKAHEIVAGSLNTVEKGQLITIESTAEGREGYFFDYCRQARSLQESNKKLSAMDFRFFFFPWYNNPEYSLDLPLSLTDGLQQYFTDLELKINRKLTDSQKMWYYKKVLLLGDKMRQEYPSTPDEAFESSNEGLYYGSQLSELRRAGQIGIVNPHPSLRLVAGLDLGRNDSTVIWWAQVDKIGNIRVIDYYANNGMKLQHYADKLHKKREELGITYSHIFFPHDVEVTDLTQEISRKQILEDLGIPVTTIPRMGIDDGIELVRESLANCWFDEVRCSDGIKALDSYRKEWNDRYGCYSNKPRHDWASDPADAFRYLCAGIKLFYSSTQTGYSEQELYRLNAIHARVV